MASDHGHEMVTVSKSTLERLVWISGYTDFISYWPDVDVLQEAFERLDCSEQAVETSRRGNTASNSSAVIAVASPPATSDQTTTRGTAATGITPHIAASGVAALSFINADVTPVGSVPDDSFLRSYFVDHNRTDAARVEAVNERLSAVPKACRMEPGNTIFRHSEHRVSKPYLDLAVCDRVVRHDTSEKGRLVMLMTELTWQKSGTGIDLDRAFELFQDLYFPSHSSQSLHLLRCCIVLATEHLSCVIPAGTDPLVRLKAALLPLCLIIGSMPGNQLTDLLWIRTAHSKVVKQLKDFPDGFVQNLCQAISQRLATYDEHLEGGISPRVLLPT